MITFLSIFIAVILICISAIVSLNEISFFSLSNTKVKAYRYSVDPNKKAVAKLLQRPKDLLVTIFLINTLANILLQNISSDIIDSISQSWWLKVGIPFAIILIFGELLPKYLGLLYNETVALLFAPFYDWFQRITSLLRQAITKTVNVISRLLFFFLKVDTPIDDKELEHILKTSEQAGLLHKEERELIHEWISLKEKLVKEIMTPRSEMQFYDIEDPLSKLIQLFQEGFSSVVVCKGSLDTVLGMCTSLDFFTHQKEIDEPQKLTKILKKPYFVPETMPTDSLIRKLEVSDQTTACVVDEYSALVGVISKKDILFLLTEPFGVKEAETEDYIPVTSHIIIANGNCPIEKINELFSTNIESSYHSVTIGGYLIEKLGSIPPSGEIYKDGDLFFRILSVDRTRIKKIYIQKRTS